MAAEIAFEKLAFALEATRGTAIAAPTHYLPLEGTVTPNQDVYRPAESRGTLEEYYRAKVMKRWVEWTASGGLDVNYAPVLFNMLIAPLTTPSTPGTAATAKLWSFKPNQTADDIKTATAWFGDPGVQIFKSPFFYADSFSISADATGSDGVTMQIGGAGQMWTKVAAPTYPAQVIGDLLIPGATQVWLDGPSDPIGTTEIIGELASADVSIDKNISRKHRNQNPTASSSIPTFSRLGRGKFHAEATVNFDFADTTKYDLWEAGDVCKLRVRYNGDYIETDAGTDLFSYVQFDIYGILDSPSWTELDNTNRGLQFTVMSQYDATYGASWGFEVQNSQGSL